MNQVQVPPFELKLRQHGATPPRNPLECPPPPKTAPKIQKSTQIHQMGGACSPPDFTTLYDAGNLFIMDVANCYFEPKGLS